MCKRWLVPAFIVLVLSGAGAVLGDTIAHWQFNGTPGEKIVADTDTVGGYVARKFYDATYGANAAKDVFYGSANPAFDTGGTSADFQNDPGDITKNDPGVGVVVADPGVNSPLDLSTVPAFTIEAFIYPRTLRQCVIVRKYGGSPGQYYIDLRDTGDIQFSINADGNAAAAGAGAVKANEWSHVAALFDEADAAAPMRIYINGELKGKATFRTRPGDTPRGLGIGCIIRDTAFPPGNSGQFFNGQIDEVRISTGALAVDQFLMNSSEGTSQPGPASGVIDVPRDTVLSWTSGRAVVAHDVYLGTSFADVNNAGRSNPGSVLVSRGQPAKTYDPPGVLALGTTYYWRVDAEAPAKGGAGTTIAKGKVWTFTVEPFSYVMTNITATASSSQGSDTGPQKTIDGSGLSAAGLHSTNLKDMWLSSVAGPQPTWIRYEFDRVYKLHEMWVWNQNQMVESTIGFGFKKVTVEYSTDALSWKTLGEFEFVRARGLEDYAHDTTVDFAGAAAKYVRLTAGSNWGGMVPQAGLSEVRFLFIPVVAREPRPADGAAAVSVEANLSWRSARDAVKHEVQLAGSRKAVVDGTAKVATVMEGNYDPALTLGTTYYWRINEVNEAAQPSRWEGDVWSFSTQEFIPVDDFESYTDKAGGEIFSTWIDGYADGFKSSGSTVGNDPAPFAEQTIVHGGTQSLPLQYDNTKTPFYSEAVRTLDQPQDWTAYGADTLMLYFRGRAAAFAQQADGSILMSGAGADIASVADEFRFASKQFSGNGAIVVRVESLTNTNAWAKAGVMIRETADMGSRFAAVYITAGNGCRFQARSTKNGSVATDNTVATAEQTAITAPYWIKLERTGDTFNGFYSADNKTWKPMASNPQTILMSANVQMGLAVTSRSAGNAATAKFSGLTTTGAVTGSWQVAAIGAEQPSNNPAPLYVAVEDNAAHVKVIAHADENAVTAESWQQWQIPLSKFSSAGVNVTKIKKLYLGVGDREKPKAGGTGRIYVDDIQFGRAPKPPAAKVAHWQFNGTAGQKIVKDVDIVVGYTAYRFNDATLAATSTSDLVYGAANPTYDSGGTSADFRNDPAANDPGVGLLVLDTGANTPLDLSTAGAFTIEAFFYPVTLRQSVIVRKYGGSGRYYIDLRADGSVGFAINADASIALAPAGTVKTNEWYHVAAVFDETDAVAPMKLYLNGTVKATAGFKTRVADSTQSLGIGCITRDNLNPSGNSGQFFHGRIDEIRISGAALAVEEFLLRGAATK